MNIVTPKVTLLAHTTLANTPEGSTAAEEWMGLDLDATDAENLIEFAGRACYQSFSKPNPKTAKNADYLARTLFEQAHWSIAEHATATLYVTGVSRALTHELIRHRHLSYSQLSQRFVNEEDANIVIPPAIREASGGIVYLQEGTYPNIEDSPSMAVEWWSQDAFYHYSKLVEHLQYEDGLSRKQAREAARSVLPNATETRIVVTGNHRAWTEVILRRIAPDADAEIQEFSRLALEALRPTAPTIYAKVDEIIAGQKDLTTP